ncbi:MAG TPA: ATP-dependent helicase HrpB [Bryobacteraceae bacterium]|nr:ATP-dependent helicase HrpB [Bryobacteraceae bacterium]
MRALSISRNLVLEAPPGAGKTTRVPPALLPMVQDEVLVLEPRRIAARMAARRVADELRERIGQTVGYQVRFEEVGGPGTRLRFLTEGVLTRRLLTDPLLRKVSAVVLDEFHERHLDADLALALLRRLQRSARPDLMLVVMSATLQAEPIAAFLGDCPVVRSEGRLFDVSVSYTPHSALPLEEQVAASVERVKGAGDTLVFLPGSAEIRRATRACEGVARSRGWMVVPLHGDLSPEEQDRAVLPADRPKLILSTNVAESSITIDGVTTVIDSGLARSASDSPWTGLPTLQVQRVSKASAIQRAGRAGRTRAGAAIRLYPYEDFQRRPDHDAPEIQRRDLSQTLLTLRAMNVDELGWFDSPPAASWQAAEALLDRLNANEDAAELARLPVHPRIGRLLLDASRRGARGDACRVAALLSAGDRLNVVDVFQALAQEPSWRAQQIEKQLRRMLRGEDAGSDEALRLATLAAFPDRVGRRRTAGDIQLSNGKPARLTGEWRSDLLIAIDVENRKDAGAPLIRLACPISAEAVVDVFPHRIEERQELVWNRDAERVEARTVVLYDSLVLEEARTLPEPEAAAQMLATKAMDAGLQRFADVEEIDGLLARSEFAAAHSKLPRLTQDDVRAALTELCQGLRSFNELESVARAGLQDVLREKAGGEALNEIAPERLPLKARQVKVHYVSGQPPWIASRLQDFFGMRDTPRIARGKAPVVAHLLAPNQRPVQMTTDLAGFWERLYPQVRRELSRRYPRHSWPEKPE